MTQRSAIPDLSGGHKPVVGRLYLVPAPLDFGCTELVHLEHVLPRETLHTASVLQYWICENAKSLRAYLKRIDRLHPLPSPLQSLHIEELPRAVHKKGDHLGQFDATALLAPALAGHDLGLVSEAGMPAIADPGSSVVRAAHDLGINVVPMTGPVSLMLALAASGLNGQNFSFVGYLAQDAPGRVNRIRALEKHALREGQTQLFIETPYRNAAMFRSLLQSLGADTRLAIASGLTLATAQTRSKTVRQWRAESWVPDNDTPVVFAIGR